MTAATQQKPVPSEQTPLLGRLDDVPDAPRVPVTVFQGSAIMVAMGLLLFIQGTVHTRLSGNTQRLTEQPPKSPR